jgi:hypothetical protein
MQVQFEEHPDKVILRKHTRSAEDFRDGFELWHTKNFPQDLGRWGETYHNAHVRGRWQGWLGAMGIPYA